MAKKVILVTARYVVLNKEKTPELQRESNYELMNFEEYKNQVADYLRKNMKYSNDELKDAFEMYEECFPYYFEHGYSIASVAAMIYNEF